MKQRNLKTASQRPGCHQAGLLHDVPAVAHFEEITTLSHKARRETEHFINSNIDDPTQGWPLISSADIKDVA